MRDSAGSDTPVVSTTPVLSSRRSSKKIDRSLLNESDYVSNTIPLSPARPPSVSLSGIMSRGDDAPTAANSAASTSRQLFADEDDGTQHVSKMSPKKPSYLSDDSSKVIDLPTMDSIEVQRETTPPPSPTAPIPSPPQSVLGLSPPSAWKTAAPVSTVSTSMVPISTVPINTPTKVPLEASAPIDTPLPSPAPAISPPAVLTPTVSFRSRIKMPSSKAGSYDEEDEFDFTGDNNNSNKKSLKKSNGKIAIAPVAVAPVSASAPLSAPIPIAPPHIPLPTAPIPTAPVPSKVIAPPPASLPVPVHIAPVSAPVHTPVLAPIIATSSSSTFKVNDTIATQPKLLLNEGNKEANKVESSQVSTYYSNIVDDDGDDVSIIEEVKEIQLATQPVLTPQPTLIVSTHEAAVGSELDQTSKPDSPAKGHNYDPPASPKLEPFATLEKATGSDPVSLSISPPRSDPTAIRPTISTSAPPSPTRATLNMSSPIPNKPDKRWISSPRNDITYNNTISSSSAASFVPTAETVRPRSPSRLMPESNTVKNAPTALPRKPEKPIKSPLVPLPSSRTSSYDVDDDAVISSYVPKPEKPTKPIALASFRGIDDSTRSRSDTEDIPSVYRPPSPDATVKSLALVASEDSSDVAAARLSLQTTPIVERVPPTTELIAVVVDEGAAPSGSYKLQLPSEPTSGSTNFDPGPPTSPPVIPLDEHEHILVTLQTEIDKHKRTIKILQNQSKIRESERIDTEQAHIKSQEIYTEQRASWVFEREKLLNTITSYDEQVESLTTQKASELSALSEKYDILLAQYKASQERVVEAEVSVKESTDTIEQLRRELEAVYTEKRELQAQLDTAKSDVIATQHMTTDVSSAISHPQHAAVVLVDEAIAATSGAAEPISLTAPEDTLRGFEADYNNIEVIGEGSDKVFALLASLPSSPIPPPSPTPFDPSPADHSSLDLTNLMGEMTSLRQSHDQAMIELAQWRQASLEHQASILAMTTAATTAMTTATHNNTESKKGQNYDKVTCDASTMTDNVVIRDFSMQTVAEATDPELLAPTTSTLVSTSTTLIPVQEKECHNYDPSVESRKSLVSLDYHDDLQE